MTTITHPQRNDKISPDLATDSVSIDCINNATLADPNELTEQVLTQVASQRRSYKIDYATLFGCPVLGAEAKGINLQSVRFLRRNLEEILRIGKRAYSLEQSVCALPGKEGPEVEVRCWLMEEGEPGRVTRFALAFYKWFSQQTVHWQRFIKIFAKPWSFSSLEILLKLSNEDSKILDLFFWGAEQVKLNRKHRKIEVTAEALKAIAKSCKGIRKLPKHQGLEIADWVYIFWLAQVEKERFNEVQNAARAISVLANREEAILEDALAALDDLGYDTFGLKRAKNVEKPVKEKVFTETQFNHRVQELEASYQVQLIAKDEIVAAIDQELATEKAQRLAAEERAIAAEKQARIDSQRASEAEEQLEVMRKKLDLAYSFSQPNEKVETVDVTPAPQSGEKIADGNADKEPVVNYKSYDKIIVTDTKQYKHYYFLVILFNCGATILKNRF
jgi:hypothetical protein